jgi:glycosyltransferase involved in cell wall biosynthesis
MPDIEPNNNILPPEWLVPAYKVGSFSPRTEVDIYEVDPKALADKIDEIINQWDIAEESEKANQIAETISWQALKIEYIKAMESLL